MLGKGAKHHIGIGQKEMIDLTVRCRLGLYVLVELARTPDEQKSVVELRDILSVSENHLSKVMQTLSRAKWISGARGPGGGYRLLIKPAKVTMFDVFVLFEGHPDRQECSLKSGGECSLESTCRIKCVVRKIEDHAYAVMKKATLKSLI